MTRNRSLMLKECLNSLGSFEYPVIISDNSDEKISYQNFSNLKQVKFINRGGRLSGNEHLQMIFEEVKAETFMIFHDDDLFIPENLYAYIKFALKNRGNYPVFCANCYPFRNKNIIFPHRKLKDKILNLNEVSKNYLSLFSEGVPALSSFIYSKAFIRKNKLIYGDVDAGKFSDALFISDIAKRTDIYFYSKPIFFRRLHDQNDQNSFQFKEYNKVFQKLSQYEYKEKTNYYRLTHLIILLKSKGREKLITPKMKMYYTFFKFIKMYFKLTRKIYLIRKMKISI